MARARHSFRVGAASNRWTSLIGPAIARMVGEGIAFGLERLAFIRARAHGDHQLAPRSLYWPILVIRTHQDPDDSRSQLFVDPVFKPSKKSSTSLRLSEQRRPDRRAAQTLARRDRLEAAGRCHDAQADRRKNARGSSMPPARQPAQGRPALAPFLTADRKPGRLGHSTGKGTRSFETSLGTTAARRRHPSLESSRRQREKPRYRRDEHPPTTADQVSQGTESR